MDNDTQQEKMIIPSFGGAEDVSVGRSNYFLTTPCRAWDRVLLLQFERDRSLMTQDSILCALCLENPATSNSFFLNLTLKSQCQPRISFFFSTPFFLPQSFLFLSNFSLFLLLFPLKFFLQHKHNNSSKIQKLEKMPISCEISTIYRNNQWFRLI